LNRNQPLLEVMRTLDEKKLSVLAVIRDNGQLLGLLEKQAIVKLMQGPNVQKCVQPQLTNALCHVKC
jgi:predicted transcriptional regulator